MTDQAERIILEAEEQPVIDSVSKANSALDSFEKKAESSHGRVIRITDQTRSSVQRLIASLEKQAETYGKSGVEKLIAQRDQLLQRYAKEPAAIDAITKSYERMVAEQKKVESEAKFEGFGEKVKQFIENPLQGAKSAFSSLLSAMGPWGTAIAAGAAVLGSIALAGFEAAKSLGEYGRSIKDAELRTGLTSKEVGQFGFAARMAGQDISIFERMMKGLSQATSENSKEGEKAKVTLKSLGVDLRDATGELKPTSELFESIAAGLAKLPEGVQRDAAALDIFKRAGIEAIPVIEGLNEHIKRAKELGLGATEEDLKRWEKYHEAVTEAEVLWERFTRKIKEPLAAVVTFFLRDESGHRIDPQNFRLGPDGKWSRPTPGQYNQARASAGFGKSDSDIWQENRNRDNILDYLGKVDAHQHTQTAIKAYEASQGLTGQLKQAEEALSKMTKPEDATTEKQVSDYAAAEKHVESLKNQIEATKHATQQATEQLKEFRRAAAEFEKKGDEAELDAIGKIYYQRDLLLKQAAQVKASEKEIADIRKAADEQTARIYDKSRADFLQYDATRERGPNQKLIWSEQIKDWEAGFTAQERIEDIEVQAQKAELQRRASRAARMAELGGGTDEEVAQQTNQTRVNLAIQLAGIEAARIAKEDDANKKSVMAAQAQKDLFTALAETQDQFDEKQAQMQQKREQELQSQVDGLQKQAERLFDVLFTKPKNFGKDLANTIHSAVIKPVVETISTGTANLLHPLIYGSGGNGGINGLFHPKSQDLVRVSTDQNTAATMQNSAALAALTVIMAASVGVAAPHVMEGTTGLPGISVPSISAPMSAPSFFSGGAQSILPGIVLPDFGSTGGAGAPTSSWSGGGSSSIATPSFVRGGGSGRTVGGGVNLGGMLGGLKGTFSKDNWWNNDIYTGAGSATTAAGIGGIGGGLAAALTSKGAGQVELAAGMPLTMAGLTGSRRGTWGGIAESTGGGALVGAGIGTMIMPGIGTAIGAGIGAAAGFTAGALEKLAGVESPQQKAHDDIKSIYGVDIPTNSGTIKQVVSLAQSQYGGDMAVAVRSPSVRQLVMLYSEATGQKMPLSATTPYSGSLVEQSGKLYQQATYQDGHAHVYASPLPTLGGISGGTYPTTGAPNTAGGTGVSLALNINGTPITPEFVADQSMAAQDSSYGRTQQAANLQVPGLMVA